MQDLVTAELQAKKQKLLVHLQVRVQGGWVAYADKAAGPLQETLYGGVEVLYY